MNTNPPQSNQAAKDVEEILEKVHNSGRNFEVPGLWESKDYLEPDQAKAALLKVLLEGRPKKERVRGTPNTEERKLRAMWNRGHNRAIDEYDNFIKSVLGGSND